MKQEGSGNKRRISFLMPYIDFCFMLIIIFVGMLSIAYFEPLGSTDVETKQESKIDRVRGEHEKTPVGIQKMNLGVGEEDPGVGVRPLGGRRAGRQASVPGAKPAAPDAKAAQTAPPSEKTGADVRELERLKKEIEQRNAEIEELKKHQGVPAEETGRGDSEPGNHYYLDLRTRKKSRSRESDQGQ